MPTPRLRQFWTLLILLTGTVASMFAASHGPGSGHCTPKATACSASWPCTGKRWPSASTATAPCPKCWRWTRNCKTPCAAL